MKDSVYKNRGGKYLSSRGARIFYFVKNKGGKYASAPVRTVAFFTS